MAPKNSEKQLGELGLHQLPGQILIEEDLETEHWYDAQPAWPSPSSLTSSNTLRATKSQWNDLATEALSSASRLFDKRVDSKTTKSKNEGLTASDKIASLTLSIQESPVHRLDELRTLLSMSEKRGRERSLSLDALNDLFIHNLLPDKRILLSLYDRNFICDRKELSKRHLMYGLFESELKTIYKEFIQIIEECGRDNVLFFKRKAVQLTFALLVAKPENEKLLLAMLVNKLGDPDKSISSATMHKLSLLIGKHHPQMRSVVVSEVVQLLRRPNLSRRAQYYAVCFLNQIPFQENDTALARSIVQIYMDLFLMCIHEKPKQDQDQESTITNPNTVTGDDENSNILKAKKRKKQTRKKNFKKKKQNEQGGKNKELISEEVKNSRFMGSLLVGVNRAFPYTKPEQDEDTSYTKHFENLFKIAHADSLVPATQALALLFQISQTNAVQNDRLYQALYGRMFDAAESGERIQAPFLHLVMKVISTDSDMKRVKAFAKRLMQSAMMGSAAYAGACMVVFFECLRKGGVQHKGLLTSFLSLAENDDEDEIFFDADKLDQENKKADDDDDGAMDMSGLESDEDEDPLSDENNNEISKKKNKKQRTTGNKSGMGHDDNGSKQEEKDKETQYDPKKRDPKYARAERSSLWEAVSLACHFHPSVSMFAKSLCKDLKTPQVDGDPLRDYSLITFLDRFCYKRAKNRVGKSLYGKRSTRYRDNPVANSVEFQRLVEAGNVHADDEFFVKFFKEKPDRVVSENVGDGGEGGSGSDIDSEEEAYEMAIEAEMKRLGGDMSAFGSRGPDVDENDVDELKAFEKAFGNDIAGSDGDDAESDKNEDEGVLSGGKVKSKRGDDGESGGEKVPNMSVFAAAEDFEQAINEDLQKEQSDLNMEEAEEAGLEENDDEDDEPRLTQKKRRENVSADRPSKRRKRSKAVKR